MFLKSSLHEQEYVRTNQKHIGEIRMLMQIKDAAVSSSETVLYDLAGVISLVYVFFSALHLPVVF